jgi:hypothetical protein
MAMIRREVLGAGAALGALGLMGRPAWAADELSYPIKVIYNAPLTAVSIDGNEALPFLVDTGGQAVTIDSAAAEKMGLAKAKDISFGAAKFKLTRYQAKEVLIGGALQMRDQTITALPARATDLAKGRVPATLGAPIRIDFEAGRVRFVKSLAAEIEGLQSVGYTYRESGAARDTISPQPIITAEIDGAPARLRLDSASTAGVTLSSRYVRVKGLWDRYGAGLAHEGVGAFGAYKMVKAERLGIDKYAFAAPIIRLSDPDAPEASADAPDDASFAPLVPSDGTIGMEMLRRFHIIIDPRTGRVFFTPNSAVADGYRYDRAGIEIDQGEDGPKIAAVAPDSPAAAAGLKAGDKLTGWNGEGGVNGLVWALQGAPGDKIALRIERDGAQSVCEVVLAERL